MGASEQQSGMTAPVLGRRCNLVFPEESAHPAVPCRVRPLRILEDELAAMVDWEEVRIECTWSYVPVPEGATVPPPQPLVVAHTLAGGQGPDLRLLPDPEPSARKEFEEQHRQDLEAGQCLLVFFDTRDLELVLVPVMVAEGQNAPTPAYWGYTVPAYLLSLMARVLHLGKLVVVLDLDETLLLAHTKDTLEQRKAAIQSDMKQKTAQVAAVQGRQQDAEQRRLLESELSVLTEEQALIERDLELLKQFKEGAQVKVVNTHPEGAVKTTILADWETVREPGYSNPGQVKRPVIRLTQPGQPMTILTRVDPSKPSTSILLRPRTRWEELLHNLNGDKDFRKNQLLKKRWEVYICTTAERRYAQLAWSLLDPQGSLFPLQELPWRLLSVPSRQKKDLLNVLRLQTLQALEQPLATDTTRMERPPLPTVVPMCVIVDDRTEVYDPVSRQAVLQVLPFNPYLEAACQKLGAQGVPSHVWQQVEDSRKELIRVLELLMHVRSQSYLHVDTVIKKKANTLPVTGCPEDQQSSAEAILSWLRPLPPVQAFLKNQRRPASLPAADQPQLGESQHLYGHPYVQEDDMPEQPSLEQLDPAQQQQQQVFVQQQESGPISRKRSHDLSVNPADLESHFAAAATPAAVAQQQGTYVKRELVDEQFEPPAKLPRTSGPQATVTGPAAAGGDGAGDLVAAAGSTQPMGAAAGSARQAVWAAAQAGGDNGSYLSQQQQTCSVLRLPPGLSSGNPPGLGTAATQGGMPLQQQPVAPTQLPNALSSKQSGQQLLPGLRLMSGSGRQQQRQSLQEQQSGASLSSWPQIPGLQRSTQSSEPQQQQQQQQQRADETQKPGETGLLPASSAGQQQQQPQGPNAGLGDSAAAAAAGASRPAAGAAESPAAAAAAAACGAPEGQQLPLSEAAAGSSRQSLEQQQRQQQQQQQHALLLPHGLQMLQKYLQEQPQLARQAQQAAIAAAAAARANGSSDSDALAPHKRALAALKAAAEAPGNAEAQQQYRELIPAAWQQLGSAQDLWRVLQLLRACKASNACAEMSQKDQKLTASMVELVFLDADVAAFCGAAGAADVDRRVAAAMAAEQAEAAGDPRVAAAASAVQARVAAQRAAAVGGIPAAPADGAAASAPVRAAGTSRATANQPPGTSSAAAAAAARKARGAGAAAVAIPRTTGSGADPGRPAAAQQQQQQALLPQQEQQHQQDEEEEDHELQALQEETSCPSTPPAPPPPPPIEQQRPQMLPPHQHYLQQLRSQESAIQLRQGQQANLTAARGLAAQPSSTMAAAAAAAAGAVNSDSEGLQGLCSSGEEQGAPGGPRGSGRSSSDMSESSGDSQRGSSQRARRVQQQQQQQQSPPPPPPPLPEEEQSPPPPLPSPLLEQLEQEEQQPLLPQGVQPLQQQQQQTARLQQHTAPPWKAVRPGQPAGGSPANTSRGNSTPWGRAAATPVWRASLSAATQTSQHPNTTAAAAAGGGGGSDSAAAGDVWAGRQQHGVGVQGGGSSGRAADGEQQQQQQGLSAGLQHVQREGSVSLASRQSQAQVQKYSWWVPPEADEPAGGEGQGGGEEEGGGDTDTCEEGSEDNRPPQTAQQELEAHFGKRVKYNFEKMERTGNGSVMVMCAKLHKTTCIDSEVIESAMASAAHPALAVEAAARKLAEQLGLQVPPSP